MKIDLGRALKSVAKFAKANPEIALGVAGIVAPKLVKKAAPVLIPLVVKGNDR